MNEESSHGDPAGTGSSRNDAIESICHAAGHRLEALARQRCEKQMTEGEFIAAVLRIEAEEIAPHGLTLIASNTLDDWTVFKVKRKGDPEVCAAFEFLPETGQFRRVGSGP